MKSRQSQHEHSRDMASDDESGDMQPQQQPQPRNRKRGRSTGGGGSGGGGSGSSGGAEKSKSVKLYCVCRKPDDGTPMFQCDGCEEWFHQRCVGVNLSKLKNKKAYCPMCAKAMRDAAAASDVKREAGGASPSPSPAASPTPGAAGTVGAGDDGEPAKKKAKTYAWTGAVRCEGLGCFSVAAQMVCGTAEMADAMPACLAVKQRLALDRLHEYLHRSSVASSRRRCVMRLEAAGTDLDLLSYNSLHKYFLSKNRFASSFPFPIHVSLVSHVCVCFRAGFVEVKGPSKKAYQVMYMLPLQCNATSLPAFISQDSTAVQNKRVVTSGAQKPRFLLILMSERNPPPLSSSPGDGTASADPPSSSSLSSSSSSMQ